MSALTGKTRRALEVAMGAEGTPATDELDAVLTTALAGGGAAVTLLALNVAAMAGMAGTATSVLFLAGTRGSGSLFTWSAAGVDDSIITFPAANGAHWVRQYDGGLLVDWAGAVAGTDTAPIAAANDTAIAAVIAKAIALNVPTLARSGQTYSLSAEIQGTAGFRVYATVPGMHVELKLSSTVAAGAVRSVIRWGHTSAGSVGDQCGADSLFLNPNFRGVHAHVFAGCSLGKFTNMKWMNALNHGVRFKPTADGGGASINDGNIFDNVWMENNGTIYATTAITGNYSPDHTGGLVVALTGASIDSTVVVAGGKTTLTMNGYDSNNMTYLERWAPIRVSTGANKRWFVIDSWTRVSAVQTTFSCWVADSTNSSDNQPLALSTQDFAIGCGDNWHEDNHNDNNLNQILGGISRSPAGYSWAFDGLYGTYCRTLECDQQMFYAGRLGSGVVMYNPTIEQMYVEPTGQVIHRRAIAAFSGQIVKISLSADGMSAGAQAAGLGHFDIFPNGALLQGYIDDALGRTGIGNNGFKDFSQVSVGNPSAPFDATGGLRVPSFQAARTAGITLTNALAGTNNYFDTSGGALQVTLDSALVVGNQFTIEKVDASANPLTITGGGCTINGQASYSLTRPGQSVTLVKRVGGAYQVLAVGGLNPSQLVINTTVGATTAAVGDLTGADYTVARYTLVGAANLTTRTATQMFAEHPGALVGDSYVLEIINTSGGTTTLVAGAGVTLTGTMTMLTNTTRKFIVKFTSTTTVTIDSVTTGVP